MRKKAEEALRYQAKLVEHVSDAIIGLDADGRIDSWNPAAEEMYGWTRDAVIGQKFADVVGADPRLGLESAKHLETVHRRADGTCSRSASRSRSVLGRGPRGHRRGGGLRRHHRAPPLRGRPPRARGALHRRRRVARGGHRRQRRPGHDHRGEPGRGEHPRPAHHGRGAPRRRVQRRAARPPPRRLPHHRRRAPDRPHAPHRRVVHERADRHRARGSRAALAVVELPPVAPRRPAARTGWSARSPMSPSGAGPSASSTTRRPTTRSPAWRTDRSSSRTCARPSTTPAAAGRASASCSSTSTASRWSTTRRATSSATRC